MESAPYTQSLLLYAYKESARALVEALHARGHPAIRPKHGALFANIDREGTRATVLAGRAGLGKAAMGELIDGLERLGYVARIADPEDRRAKLVILTESGREVPRIVHAFNEGMEKNYRKQLGDEAYESFRRFLIEIGGEGGGMQPRIR
jgi:DNA-binding MarR family transcriptional regulator